MRTGGADRGGGASRRALAPLANVLLMLGLCGLVLAGSAWGLRASPPGRLVLGWLSVAVSRWPVPPVLDRWLRPAAAPGDLTGASRNAPPQPPQSLQAAHEARSSLATDLSAPEADERAAQQGAMADATDTASDELPQPPTLPPEAPRLPITRVALPRLLLAADVVPAPIITVAGGTSWDVPPFAVGHGENSAGAGQPGNAVLLGHVTSPNAGSVFKDLYRMQVGDSVHVFSGEQEFAYAVTEVRIVSRSDLSTLMPTESATVTLITCTGMWLPALQDFSQRLAVRAELLPGPARP